MRPVLLVATAVALMCTAATARATTEPEILMHVKVSLLPSKITLSSNYAARGLEVEFRVRNQTAAKRVFSVAGKTITIPPRALRITAISFQARGRYTVVSRIGTKRIKTYFRVT
jgi:hypothetical protein